MDDAALFFPEGSPCAFVYTMDVITPIVDDPRAFGRIAAANALSDVYAMGGVAQLALSYVGLPDVLGLDVLEAILAGAAEKAAEGGCGVVGGHTIKSAEPQCGLAVIGSVDPQAAWIQSRGQAGQALVLTKALGTGVLSQALKAGALSEEAFAPALASMQTLNAAACEAGRRAGVTAATDVTGFGLLGHLQHLVGASGLMARLDATAVPLLPGALDAARGGHVPGGSRRNARYAAPHVDAAAGLDEALMILLADAQTSGGLLMAVSPEGARALVGELEGAAIIGELVAGEGGRIRVT